MLDKATRLWHTVKYLKPIQFYWRIWFKWVKPSPDLSPAPLRSQSSGSWVTGTPKKPSFSKPDGFHFLGEEGALSSVGWGGPEREKLWRYNQHYFDYLNAINSVQHKSAVPAILDSWLNEVEPGTGDGWEPYPTSLRMVNWIKWSLAGNSLPQGFDASLAVQARWLMKRLEYHLLGNHLFANAKALVFVGLYFEGDEARLWLTKGLSIIDSQLEEQILRDGGHFERSPMYHAIALEDMLDLYNVAIYYGQNSNQSLQQSTLSWQLLLPKMRSWLENMLHPDGALSFFNDTALGIAPEWPELEGYYKRSVLADQLDHDAAVANQAVSGNDAWTTIDVDLKYAHMSDSGYIRIEAGSMCAIVDAAPIGPDYLPGHAHADTLSFELSLGNQRIFVNSGTSCYGASSERVRQRGTAAHNTVVVDGEDSSEVWSGFRVARRARVGQESIQNSLDSELEPGSSSVSVSAEHDGYSRLAGKPIHSRQWDFSANSLRVTDHVTGQFNTAEARYHLHPDVTIHETDRVAEFELRTRMGTIAKVFVKNCTFHLEESTWHPEFGLSIPNQCVVLQLKDSQCELTLSV